jgi:hypothetical protein
VRRVEKSAREVRRIKKNASARCEGLKEMPARGATGCKKCPRGKECGRRRAGTSASWCYVLEAAARGMQTEWDDGGRRRASEDDVTPKVEGTDVGVDDGG